MPDWNRLTIDAIHDERLGETARVLDERLDPTDGHRAVGDANATEDGNGDEVQVADQHRCWLDHAGNELGAEACLVEFVVGLAETRSRLPVGGQMP